MGASVPLGSDHNSWFRGHSDKPVGGVTLINATSAPNAATCETCVRCKGEVIVWINFEYGMFFIRLMYSLPYIKNTPHVSANSCAIKPFYL